MRMAIAAVGAAGVISMGIGAMYVFQQEGSGGITESQEERQARPFQASPVQDGSDRADLGGEESVEEQKPEEFGLPEPLKPAWPDEIAPVRNACASLQVPEHIKQTAEELEGQRVQAERAAQELRQKYLAAGSDSPVPTGAGEVFRGDPNRKAVALTIDTGTGGAEGIEQILALGRHYDISFTFFLTGCWVLENPELTQQIAREGHGIANHTLTHLNLGAASDAQARREIGETHRILGEVLGWQPALFRKPQYAGGDRIVNLLAEYDMVSVQGWPDFGDTQGWRAGTTGEDVVRLVKSKTAPGAIWVLHNLSLADLHAFEDNIRFHLQEGYEIIPVEEMLR